MKERKSRSTIFARAQPIPVRRIGGLSLIQ